MKYNNTETIENIKKSKYFKPMDIATIVVMLIMLVALLVLVFMPKGSKVVIRVDGKILYEYSLMEDREILVQIDENNYNVVVIENGEVYISKATCKNKVCVETGKISKVGETIACLPNKLIVEIVGNNREVDTTIWEN